MEVLYHYTRALANVYESVVCSAEPTRVEQLGVALGYVAHLIHHLGKILFIPLLYPIRPQGSKSVILDLVSEETLIDNIKE